MRRTRRISIGKALRSRREVDDTFALLCRRTQKRVRLGLWLSCFVQNQAHPSPAAHLHRILIVVLIVVIAVAFFIVGVADRNVVFVFLTGAGHKAARSA